MAKRAKSSHSYVDLPDDDRIIKLPDGVRSHILSFLPIKDAVATTILSTKWKNLWTTINKIVFKDYLFPFNCAREFSDYDHGTQAEERKLNTIKFARVVNKVLLFNNAPVMKRFSLNCKDDSCVCDIHSWVSIVILKKIEDLRLSIEAEFDAPIQLPTSLFTCDTLEVLKLAGSIFVRELSSCSLPRLKTLKLLSIKYENDESARKLISSCPSLESLHISRDMDGVENFIISSSTLRDLSIDQTDYDESDLSNHVINTPGLQHLTLCLGSVNGLSIGNLSSLVKTDIIFSGILDNGSYDNFSNLLREISNAKILNIMTSMFQTAFPAHIFPKFDRLSALEMSTGCCSWDSLQVFIMNSDRLETLSLSKGYYCREETHVDGACWRNPETVPTCLLSSLKKMTFFGLEGQEDELAMVEYILKNAKVFQEMKIRFQKTESRLTEKLLEFKRGSEECRVIIC